MPALLSPNPTSGSVAFTSSGAPIVSIFDPPHCFYVGAGAIQLAGNPLRYRVDTNAGYVLDTANYHDFIIVNAGIRYDDYHITSANNASSQAADDGITSYNVGLVVKPMKIGSLYFAYATAADPVGDELDATASLYGGLAATQPTTQIFGPQKSQSYEIGTKWELLDRHLLVSAAPFETIVTNARETAPARIAWLHQRPVSSQAQPTACEYLRLRSCWQAHRQMERDDRPVVMDPKVTKSIVPDQRGPAISQHRSPIVQPSHQIPAYEPVRTRRAKRLRLEDRGRFAARCERRYRLPWRTEPDLPAFVLAVRRLRRDQDQLLFEAEIRWAEPHEQDLLRLAVPELAAVRQSCARQGVLSKSGL